MKNLKVILSFLAILIAASQMHVLAQTEEVKIGFVDPQSVLAKMPEMKAVQQRIQNFAERKQQELYQKEEAYQNQVAEYESKAGVISDEANQREQQRLAQLQQDLLQAQRQAEADLQAKREELLGPLLSQIGDAIDTVAQDMGLTYVLNTTTSTGDVIILYASEEYRTKYNITQQVMQELGMFN